MGPRLSSSLIRLKMDCVPDMRGAGRLGGSQPQPLPSTLSRPSRVVPGESSLLFLDCFTVMMRGACELADHRILHYSSGPPAWDLQHGKPDAVKGTPCLAGGSRFGKSQKSYIRQQSSFAFPFAVKSTFLIVTPRLTVDTSLSCCKRNYALLFRVTRKPSRCLWPWDIRARNMRSPSLRRRHLTSRG